MRNGSLSRRVFLSRFGRFCGAVALVANVQLASGFPGGGGTNCRSIDRSRDPTFPTIGCHMTEGPPATAPRASCAPTCESPNSQYYLGYGDCCIPAPPLDSCPGYSQALAVCCNAGLCFCFDGALI